MRFNRPFEIGLLAASGIVFCLIATIIPLKYLDFIQISWAWLFLVIFLSAITVFMLVSWSVNKFLYAKVKLIYKTILSQKIRRDTKKNIRINPRLLDEVHDKVEDWVEINNSEIEKLIEQEAFRREFLGNLAHELKTPIFSIQGYILTLLEGGLEDPSVNRVFLERAANGVERITAILEDLDEITRLESGRTELNLRKINIVELARDCFENLEMRAKEKGITLQFNHKYEKPVYVLCDKEKIAQVFNNLLVNSINYGKQDGKTDIRFFDMEDKILVEVADNGLGMSQEHLPRIFERFYRVEKSRARNVGGSGLGLAIVKHIIEVHKQSINVRSTVDIGTTFTFTLDKAK
jgi:two-component system phosphate regulon sensor histidine kinase PhoR